jgi:DNA-directed RNA polymerase specialized sigma24 family protein
MRTMLQQDRCTQNDYVRVFADSAEPLRWLCYTLTGDEELSEKVLRSAFAQSLKGADCAFRDWMVSWARRLIIQACIALTHPTGDSLEECIYLHNKADGSGISDQLELALSQPSEALQQRLLGLIRYRDLFSCCGRWKGIRTARRRFCLRSATERASRSISGRSRPFSQSCTF